MALKRQLHGGNEDDSHLPANRQNEFSIVSGWNLQAYTQRLEAKIRNIVREEVTKSVESSSISRSCLGEVECSGSRGLHLLFETKFPQTIFTGSKLLSEDDSPIKIVLFDPHTHAIVTSGPQSSIKVSIVVIDADFGPEDWTANEFDSKVVKNREGKRPLLTGELSVSFHEGAGLLTDVTFTDNSSWCRSKKFRLGAKASNSDIHEAISNPFRVKDHRGESYKKLFPPHPDSEVWRLKQISMNGPYCKKLQGSKILTVGDLLRLYFTNQQELRKILGGCPEKTWDLIIKHAKTCLPGEKRYEYKTIEGSVLFFDSVYRVVGVNFNGGNNLSVDELDADQKKRVEELKLCVYQKMKYAEPDVYYQNPTPGSADPVNGIDFWVHDEFYNPESYIK